MKKSHLKVMYPLLFLLVLLAGLLFAGCSKQDFASDQSQFNWQIEVYDCELKSELVTENTITQYDGTNEKVTEKISPTPGNQFLLIDLSVDKAKAGGSGFEWAKLDLIDAEENIYKRADDNFLSNHGYMRISGLDLRIGQNRGWICFEVPSGKSDKYLLTYHADEGDNLIPLKL